MRLLFLVPYLPSPPSSGGAMRMHGLMSSLGRRHEVAVLAFREYGDDAGTAVQQTGRYAQLVGTVFNTRIGAQGAQKRIAQLRSLGSRHSYEQSTYFSVSYQHSMDRLVDRWRPDAIIVEFMQMGYHRMPDGVPVILDAHNVEHEILSRMARVERSPARRLYSAVNGRKLRREEAVLARRVNGLAVTSARDREIFQEFSGGIVPAIVPNGVDTTSFAPSAALEDPNKVLFFGALDYFPNEDAALYFRRAVWPLIQQQNPEVQWDIVGRQPPGSVLALDDEPGINVRGLVDDIRTAIAGAAVVVVPLRAGSGTRLKILEAMAMAKPVVTTSLGAEGLDIEHGQHAFIADNPVSFADAAALLLSSSELRREMGARARAFVEAHHDWQAISVGFEDLIVQTVERHRIKRSSK